jgi:uncharacterized membrane protein
MSRRLNDAKWMRAEDDQLRAASASGEPVAAISTRLCRQVGRAMQVGAGYRAAEVSNTWWRRRQCAPKGARNGNYKHGRYTEEVQATRRWLREAAQLLRSFR